ncbi:MAG: LysR family transcriptional regulator [Lachnospiraceae bacterium]|nr:LysR family transcriptional regulator [Lachnospiraceae bacterium]
MNFSSMEYFTVLAQERSFTRAAERLHITQQSLSSHIAGMEKELGSQLVVRRVPLELTYAGEAMLRYATGFQKLHNDMQREFCDISQKQKGILRVGAASTRGQMILPKTIALFQESYPNISVELTEGPNGALHQKLLKGTIDLAIADFPENLPDISLTDFYREENVLVIEKRLFDKCFTFGAEECEKRLLAGDYSALREFPFVLGGIDDIDGRIGRDVLRRADIDNPIVTATSHNVGILLRLSLSGVGACVCPEKIVRSVLTPEQLDSVWMFPLGAETANHIQFGYPKQSYQWSAIEKFITCAKAVVCRE